MWIESNIIRNLYIYYCKTKKKKKPQGVVGHPKQLFEPPLINFLFFFLFRFILFLSRLKNRTDKTWVEFKFKKPIQTFKKKWKRINNCCTTVNTIHVQLCICGNLFLFIFQNNDLAFPLKVISSFFFFK